MELTLKGICENLPRQVSAMIMLMRLNKSETTVHGCLVHMGVQAGERGRSAAPESQNFSGKKNWDRLF